jgi:MFS family permease
MNPMKRVLGLRDFRLLFTGSATSLLGDQFALIATPWLTLQLTGDPLALGVILALGGVPRAVFMLLGGAITDRISPRWIMLVSDIIRLILTLLMTLAVFTGMIQVWMLYAFALGFGLVAGFAIPAQNSIVPMIVNEGDLQAGNSMMMGIGQLIGFIGPTIAGILIGTHSGSTQGIAFAFGIDSVSFGVSALALMLMRVGRGRAASTDGTGGSLLGSIADGMKFLWSDEALRIMFLTLTAINFLLLGPLLVGIPVLANQRLPEKAVAFGLLMSAFSGGNLVGFLLAGTLPRPGGQVTKWIITLVLGSFGAVVMLLACIPSTWVDFALLSMLGLGNGYIAIILYTWMQTRTPKEMLGRTMSILMFSHTGLLPISQALSGAISKWSLDVLFVSAGFLVIVATAVAVMQPGFTLFTQSLSAHNAAQESD